MRWRSRGLSCFFGFDNYMYFIEWSISKYLLLEILIFRCLYRNALYSLAFIPTDCCFEVLAWNPCLITSWASCDCILVWVWNIWVTGRNGLVNFVPSLAFLLFLVWIIHICFLIPPKVRLGCPTPYRRLPWLLQWSSAYRCHHPWWAARVIVVDRLQIFGTRVIVCFLYTLIGELQLRILHSALCRHRPWFGFRFLGVSGLSSLIQNLVRMITTFQLLGPTQRLVQCLITLSRRYLQV